MQIQSNTPEYEKDLKELAMLFYPKNSNTAESVTVLHSYEILNNGDIKNTFTIKELCNEFTHSRIDDSTMQSKISIRKILHLGLYETLSKYLKVDMPWGALVGIRPVKMARNLLENGVSNAGLTNYLQKTYYISKQKAELVQEIIENQKYITKNDKLINFYVNIPFCKTRCNYCSFISAEIDKCKSLVEPYVQALISEIKHTKQLIANNNYIVKGIYIGGGTPTALNANQLEKILMELSYDVKEFTVEAGRPDTITKEKLEVFKEYGVTRISINPQSFNEKVLVQADRNHTIQELLEVYKIAMQLGFIVNMDIIAGLSGESLKSFKEGINTLLELAPDNITVHTLSLKRASTLNKNATNIFKKSQASKMLDYATEKLKEDGYKSYYMYRQKNMVGNLENIGFSKNSTVCQFNIDSIDEHVSVVACGAGGISKRIYSLESRHERSANVKGIKEYIERLDEMKHRKVALFK